MKETTTPVPPEHLDFLSSVTDRLENGGDDAYQASAWDDLRQLASSALAELDVTVHVVPQELTDDPIEPLLYNGSPDQPKRAWPATPGEVVTWCSHAGFDFEIAGKAVIECRFDGKPDDDVRAALKQAGFGWNKHGKAWTHKAFGQYARSEKVTGERHEPEPPEQVAA